MIYWYAFRIMKYKLILLFITLSSAGVCSLYAQEHIKDFHISNYNEDGSPDWVVKGREATVHDTHVDIEDMEAKYYSKDDTIDIESDTAKMDKKKMDVYLKDNVKIASKDGVTLETDSLDWQRTDNKINTKDWVEVKKDDFQLKAKGLDGDTQFKDVDFKENIQMQIPNEDGKDFTIITCKGPLEIEYKAGKAVFNDEVIVESTEGKMYSDKTTVFFNLDEKKMEKMVAEGNVKIMRGENITFAKKATYFGEDGKIVLEGQPRLIYFPEK